jgi:hypothetical protein
VYGFLFAPACYMHCPAYPPQFSHSNNNPQRVPVITRPIFGFLHPSCSPPVPAPTPCTLFSNTHGPRCSLHVTDQVTEQHNKS